VIVRSRVIIRPARDDDLPAVLGLLAQVPLDTGHDALAGPRQPVGPERDAWSRVREQPGRTLLVAEADGEIVGTADLLIVANLTHDGHPWAIMENLVVDRRHRRGGLGRALMEEVVRRAQDAGCYKVQLLSNVARTAAHELYGSLGFEPSARGYRLYF
jgi:GNAT superfamily N-acetyltransferase